MNRTPLDVYDDMPSQMRAYIQNYGWHFSQEACEWAVSKMRRADASGKMSSIDPYSKKQVEELLKRYKIEIENDVLYDGTFVANMCKADYFGSSVPDELHLAKYVKDVLDDPDAAPGTVFRRWAATMVGNGEPIDWSSFL